MGEPATATRRSGALASLRQLNRRTLPPLLVYLVAGASGFAAIAETFWVRERLGLSPPALLALAAWLTVPWTLKMVFGHLVDTVPDPRLPPARLHPARRAGPGRAALALSAAAAGSTGPVAAETVYVAASLLSVVGLVVQDSVADALTTEVVDRTLPTARRATRRWCRRRSGDRAGAGAFFNQGRRDSRGRVRAVGRRKRCRSRRCFLIAAAIPLPRSSRRPAAPRTRRLRRRDAYGAARIASGGGGGLRRRAARPRPRRPPFAPEIGLLLSLGVLLWLLRLTVAEVPRDTRRAMAAAAAVIFAFRARRPPGPGCNGGRSTRSATTRRSSACWPSSAPASPSPARSCSARASCGCRWRACSAGWRCSAPC
jgi:hypothetical protein